MFDIFDVHVIWHQDELIDQHNDGCKYNSHRYQSFRWEF